MDDVYASAGLMDRGGRRTGSERRRVSMPAYFPATRSGHERRCGLERRSGREAFAILVDARRETDRYVELFRTIRGLLWGVGIGSLLWSVIILSVLSLLV